MGRELRRVALDFDFPLGETWEGYLNPNFVACPDPDCIRGNILEYVRFDDFMRQLALAGEASYQRPDDFKPARAVTTNYSDPINEMLIEAIIKRDGRERYDAMKRESEAPRWPWPDRDPVDVLLQAADLPPDWATDVEREVIMRIAMMTPPDKKYSYHNAVRQQDSHKVRIVSRYSAEERKFNYPHPNLGEMGIADVGSKFHELVDRLGCDKHFLWRMTYDAHRKIYRAIGMKPDEGGSEYDPDGEYYCKWGHCPTCKGEGLHPDHADAYNAWEPTEPPAGNGWQVWQTVSEGGPVTPVFATADELIDYMVSDGVWDRKYSREAATTFVKGSGWAPSAVGVGDTLYDGIEGMKEVQDANGN